MRIYKTLISCFCFSHLGRLSTNMYSANKVVCVLNRTPTVYSEFVVSLTVLSVNVCLMICFWIGRYREQCMHFASSTCGISLCVEYISDKIHAVKNQPLVLSACSWWLSWWHWNSKVFAFCLRCGRWCSVVSRAGFRAGFGLVCQNDPPISDLHMKHFLNEGRFWRQLLLKQSRWLNLQ